MRSRREAWLPSRALAWLLALTVVALPSGAEAQADSAASPAADPDASPAVEETAPSPVRTGRSRGTDAGGDDELRAEGWEFEAERDRPGNAAAGVLALTVGTIWHGAGHGLVGDRATANRLFIGEGIALAAMAVGLVVRSVGDESPVGRTVGTSTMVGGGSLFAAGWVADVIGAFKGTGPELPTNTAELKGATVEFYATTLVEQGLELNSIGVLRFPFVTETWALQPEAEMAFDLGYRRLGVRGGYRARLGARGASFFELGGVGFDEAIPNDGTGRTSVAGALALSLDLGDVAAHLGGLVWTNRVEVAVDHYYFDHQDRRRFVGQNSRVHVPYEMSLGFNANQGVHIGVGYRHRDDELVGMAGRRVGVLWGRLGILPRNRLGVDLQIEQGAFTRAWFGLHFKLSRLGRSESTIAN